MLLQLRVFGSTPQLTAAAHRLEAIPGARHVVIAGEGDRRALLTADLVDDAADHAMAEVRALGLPREDVMLVRLDAIGPAAAARPFGTVVWADLLSQAGANARPIARYVVFMVAAGTIASSPGCSPSCCTRSVPGPRRCSPISSRPSAA
jgi:hypothetical protein